MASDDRQQEITSPIALLKQIQAGQIGFDTMSRDSRLACIEYLACNGHNNAELSEILKVSVRTIQRYKQVIRQQNAFQVTADFKEQQIGGLVKSAETLTERLMQISSKNGTFNKDKINALELTWKIQKETVRMFQSLGYLPYFAPLQGPDRMENTPDITEIAEGIQTIEEAITQNDITDEGTLSLLAAQKQLFVAASLNAPFSDIQGKLNDLKEPSDSKDNYES